MHAPMSIPKRTPEEAARLRNLTAAEARQLIRNGKLGTITRGVAHGYMQCAVVILTREHAFDFLVYCQRNFGPCPVVEVCDPGDWQAKRLAPGSDLRNDISRYSVYRFGERQDVDNIRDLWRDDFVSFVIGSGISWDQTLERAGIQTAANRWVLRTAIPTQPAGPFSGPLVVTMRWLTSEEAIRAVTITSRFPLAHGAPIHIGDPALIGCDLEHPFTGPPVRHIPKDVTPVFWSCSVTPQEAVKSAKLPLVITQAPSCGFITDVPTENASIPFGNREICWPLSKIPVALADGSLSA
jgi:uncharacterized protein YcsI (UPF0317 family)